MAAGLERNQSVIMHRGQCLCGAVTYTVNTVLRDIVNCHCQQCRRFHGHFAAYTAAPRDAVEIDDGRRALSWYNSSSQARRGFCRECGSSLFWDRLDSDLLRIAAGSLTEPTGLQTRCHIHVNFAGDYYKLMDDLPKKQQGLDSADIKND